VSVIDFITQMTIATFFLIPPVVFNHLFVKFMGVFYCSVIK